MKKITLIMSFLLCILCTTQAKDRVIDRPPFLAWSSTSLEVDKMVISDTATVVHIKAFYRPKNWIKIAKGSFLKDNNGQLYPIRNGIGITLDQEFWMPESGEGEFQLVFPPIPEAVTSVDFSEGDFDRAFKIWGIQLDEKASGRFSLPEEATAPKTNLKMTLPEPITKYAKAILKGKVLDFQKEMPNKGNLYLNDVIGGFMQETEILIQEDGTFYKEIDALTVSPVNLMLPQGGIKCLIAPGETTSILINTRELTRKQSRLHASDKPLGKPVYYSGYLASLQQELADNPLSLSFLGKDYERTMQEIDGKSPEEYKTYILGKLPEFRKQIMQSKCSPACKEILNIDVDLSAANFLMEAERNLKSAHVTTRKLEREEARKYFMETRIELPQGYFQCLKELPSLTSPKTRYSAQYIRLYYLDEIEQTEKTLKEGLGISNGTLFDDIKAFKVSRSIKEFSPLTAEQKEQTASLPAAYREMILKMNDDLLKKIELNKKKTGFAINEAGQVANEDLFPSIISKFRGHTLLVDFWATWCGPCRTANKAMVPMKEELKDKDIIYLYITGETSPMGTWQQMIPDIHGEHYRVTNDQWRYLMSNFNIEGVPTYFVIDPEGNITFKQTGFSGVDNMKEQLLKVLK